MLTQPNIVLVLDQVGLGIGLGIRLGRNWVNQLLSGFDWVGLDYIMYRSSPITQPDPNLSSKPKPTVQHITNAIVPVMIPIVYGRYDFLPCEDISAGSTWDCGSSASGCAIS